MRWSAQLRTPKTEAWGSGPNLKLILSHVGGAIPFLWYRLDTGFAENGTRDHISRPGSAYLRQFYYDGAISFRGALRLVFECVGDQLVPGTDFLYIAGDVERTIAATSELGAPEDAKQRTLGGNAAMLLRAPNRLREEGLP